MPVKCQDELDPSGRLCLGLGLPRGRQRPKVLLGTPQHCQRFLAHPSTLDHVWAGFVPRCGGDTGAGARGTTSPTRQGLSLSPLPRLCLVPRLHPWGWGLWEHVWSWSISGRWEHVLRFQSRRARAGLGEPSRGRCAEQAGGAQESSGDRRSGCDRPAVIVCLVVTTSPAVLNQPVHLSQTHAGPAPAQHPPGWSHWRMLHPGESLWELGTLAMCPLPGSAHPLPSQAGPVWS